MESRQGRGRHREFGRRRVRRPGRIVLTGAWLMATACGGDPSERDGDDVAAGPPGVQAVNAFYYYDDLAAAEAFYTGTLGLRTVSDFGFAKIMRAGPSSYLTLVDADSGMHSSQEPKSVTLAVVTEQVEGWYQHLTAAGVPMRAPLRVEAGRAHDGFVAVDPEGYYLEFERFNEHPENDRLLPALREVEPLTADVGDGALGILGTVLWLYYEALAPVQRFYETALGLSMLVDQGWAKVYAVSGTGYVGFVDGARGLHPATDEKAVTVSFFTADVEDWFAHLRAQPGFAFRTDELGDESGRVRTFVGYDPGGYFLEWDTFLERPGNEQLLGLLRAGAEP